MPRPRPSTRTAARPLWPLWRGVLSAHVLNGVSATLGLFLVAALIFLTLGEAAAVNASVGAIVALLPDGVQPRRGKLTHLLLAPLLGIPLFLAVQLLRPYPLELGFFLLPATFIVFLATAWGARGMAVAAAAMFAILLAMAPLPAPSVTVALLRTAWCALGALLYVLYATAAARVLNHRYRTQTLADLLFSVAALLRIHAARLQSGQADLPELARQAALANQLQTARDLILERPNSARRQRLAGMLVVVLEMRDRLIAGTLELERVDAEHAPAVAQLAAILGTLADDVTQVADALLRGRAPPPAHDLRAALDAVRIQAQNAVAANMSETRRAQAAILRSASTRLADQNAAVQQLTALARGECAPDLATVRAGWQLFVSPTYWSLYSLLRLWHWRQPALRHALRAALAMGAGYALAQLIPWGSRDYWVLITIVVVLRGNLAQTLQRRNIRVIGTVIGSLIAAVLLTVQPPVALLLAAVIVAQGLAKAFVVRRYLVTAIAGSILGLILANLLHATGTPAFDFLERVGDTLLGAAIAWIFSYVFPSWEREQLARLVQRVCRALARHARQSLALATLDELTGQPELAWRLARREAYDALSALTQAAQRARVEPRAVRPPLARLQRLQARSYQLLGQLSAVQSLLLLRRERLDLPALRPLITAAAQDIDQSLDLQRATIANSAPKDAAAPAENVLAAIPEGLPDPMVPDSSPWLRRRLALATHLARDVRAVAVPLCHAAQAHADSDSATAPAAPAPATRV